MRYKFNIGDYVKQGKQKGYIIQRYTRNKIKCYDVRFLTRDGNDGDLWGGVQESTLELNFPKVYTASCSICGNSSSYDKETLKASTKWINGCKVVLCCPCDDDLFLNLLKARISKKEMQNITHILMSDEKERLMELYNDYNKESLME